MESGNFEQFIVKVFLPATKDLKHPLILLYDGHGSHMTWNTVNACLKADVHCLCLPPHSSHALQPCDIGVFRPWKEALKLVLKNWYRQSRQKPVTNAVFPTILSGLWKALKGSWAVGGFEGSGIFPVNIAKPRVKAADVAIAAATEEASTSPDDVTPRTRERQREDH